MLNMWGFHITSITLKGLRAGDVFNSAVLDFSQTMVDRQLHLSDRRGRILKPSQVIIFYITSILFYYYTDFWSRIKSPWCVGSPLESVLYLTRQNSGSLDPGQILSLFCAFPPHCLFFFWTCRLTGALLFDHLDGIRSMSWSFRRVERLGNTQPLPH